MLNNETSILKKQNKKPPRNLQNCALLLVRYVDDDSLSGELFYDTQL